LAEKKAVEEARQVRRQQEIDSYKNELAETSMDTSKLIKPISDFGHASNVMDDALKRYE
jgi:hypothetical protein